MIQQQKNNFDGLKQPKQCYFCVNNTLQIDYKDIRTLRKFVNSFMKIFPKKRTGTCAKHQRKLVLAIKRARVMALLGFTAR